MSDQLLDDFQAAWSGRSRAAFAPCCTGDLHYEDPLCDRPLQGVDELGDHAAKLWTLFPDARVEQAGERLRGGAYVAAPVKVLGHHRGELPRLPPTNRFVVLHAVLYCELRDDRLFRVRAFYDAYDAGVQMGVLPKRGTLGERALLMLRGFGLRSP